MWCEHVYSLMFVCFHLRLWLCAEHMGRNGQVVLWRWSHGFRLLDIHSKETAAGLRTQVVLFYTAGKLSVWSAQFKAFQCILKIKHVFDLNSEYWLRRRSLSWVIYINGGECQQSEACLRKLTLVMLGILKGKLVHNFIIIWDELIISLITCHHYSGSIEQY